MFWRILKQGVFQAAILVVIAAVLALGVNAVRTKGLPLRPEPVKNTAVAVAEISLPLAWQAFQGHQALFLDARDAYMFEQGHVPGAVNVPPQSLPQAAAFVKDRSGRMVIAYCDDPDCDKGEHLAQALLKQGVANVRLMKEGWYAWQGAGFPVETKP